MYYTTNIVASAYGTGNYGSNVYNGGSTTNNSGSTTNNASGTSTTGTTGASSGTSGSVLTNTGFDIALIITIAAVLSLTAMLVRFWKKPAKKLHS